MSRKQAKNKTEAKINSKAICRSEGILLLVIILTGALLRITALPNHAIEHFDEGVYASNIWFSAADHYQYPYRHLYAPPLLPWLLEWSILLFGPTAPGTMSVGIITALSTLILIWWVAREWFGSAAGLIAASLCALNDLHALYSLTALTDVLLCFWMLLAVYGYWKAVTTNRVRLAFFAGICTALAWWTKYNGWLPIAIAFAGIFPWLWFHVRNSKQRRHAIRCWLIMSVTALLLWSPVLYELQQFGGYISVMQNHKQYAVGFAGWWNSCWRQFGNLRSLESLLSGCGLLLAFISVAMLTYLRRGRPGWNGGLDGSADSAAHHIETGQPVRRILSLGLAAFCIAIWGDLSIALLTIGLLLGGNVCFQLAYGFPAQSAEDSNSEAAEKPLAGWLVAAWFCGLLCAIPLYTPYPRLLLPWLMSCWLAIAGLASYWIDNSESVAPTDSAGAKKINFEIMMTMSLTVLMLLALFSAPFQNSPPAIWQPRTEMKSIAELISIDLTKQLQHAPGERVLYVYAEPALFFHLSTLGEIVAPVGQLDLTPAVANGQTLPTYLVTGPHAARSNTYQTDWQTHQDLYEPAIPDKNVYSYTPSPLVLLNYYSASRLENDNQTGKPPITEQIHLYRLKSSFSK